MGLTLTLRDLNFAAIATTKALDSLGFMHCYIGGYAVLALGSQRTTTDLDVLVSDDPVDVRKKLLRANNQFCVTPTNRLVYALNESESLIANVCVEIKIFYGGEGSAWGLPDVNAAPKFGMDAEEVDLNLTDDAGVPIRVLHPPFLALTKLQRWLVTSVSNDEEMMVKANNDVEDIDHLLTWTDAKDFTLDFNEFWGDRKAEFIFALRTFYTNCPSARGALQSALAEADYKVISQGPGAF